MSYDTPSEGMPYSVPNSGMAIVSLIAGILGLTFFPVIGSIVAVITGYMAQKEIRESAGAKGGSGMATAGLVMGWIGIGLMLIGICIACALFGLLIPLGILSIGDYSSQVLPGLILAS